MSTKSIPQTSSSTGLFLSSGIIISAIISTVLAILYPVNLVFSLLWIMLNTWLFTGLFIVSHDSMHGSLCPQHPRLNRALGLFSLLIYAGLSYNRLLDGHIAHHKYTVSEQDPDYSAQHLEQKPLFGFFFWYFSFMRAYLSWHPFAFMGLLLIFCTQFLGFSYSQILFFWLIPQFLSTLQLFYFGTYLPHRGEFTETLKARSNRYPKWLSLLTCYHFGYHGEHHLHPHVPWWMLPKIREKREASS